MADKTDTAPAVPSAIHHKLLRVKADMGAVAKDQRGQGISYSYRGIDAIYNAAHAALIKHGVIIYPSVVPGTFVRDIKELSTKDGRTRLQVQMHCTLQVQFIDADTGTGHAVYVIAEGYDDSDKAAGKMVSYGMKTAIAHALGLPTAVEEPDAERPDTTQDPEAVVKRIIGKLGACDSLDALKRVWEDAPPYARKDRDVIAAKDAAKERLQ
jgi:hypothetical protein